MTVIAFEGSAGCGKTHRLIETLGEVLERLPLRDGQRVLATTYMHGSRRRLHERLRSLVGLSGKYDCSTLDSVALRWVSRWRTLSAQIADPLPSPQDFDGVCTLAARLLEFDAVRAWAVSSFPIVLVDEGQDLTAERLAIVQMMARQALLLVAADEFQCLQEALRPNPFSQWAAAELHPQRLERIWRTDIADLLNTASDLRAGRAPRSGRSFRIVTTPAPGLAGTFIANQIGWFGRGGTVAILAPSITPFVRAAIDWAGRNRTRQGNGPVSIQWERAEREELVELRGRLAMPGRAPIRDALSAAEALEAPHVLPHLRAWILMQRNALGREEVERNEMEAAIEHALANRRRFGRGRGGRIAAMTIHAAKNREFDGVAVIWPYQVAGDSEHKRRLLYNAITRARSWCMVLAQGDAIMNAAPFA